MTKLTLSRSDLRSMHPCGLHERLCKFGFRSTLDASEARAAGFTLSDVLWVLGRHSDPRARWVCVKFAIYVAEQVEHLSSDPCTQAAIDAAKAVVTSRPDDYTVANGASKAAWSVRPSAAGCAARAATLAYVGSSQVSWMATRAAEWAVAMNRARGTATDLTDLDDKLWVLLIIMCN